VEKLEEVEATAKSNIQAIQQEINASAKEMATQNANTRSKSRNWRLALLVRNKI
jgi:hypothetical protein